MNPKLALVAEARGGWFTRGDALTCGYADSTIRQRVRTGQWQRLCRDGYTEPAWPDEQPWERARRLHVLTARAVHHRSGADAVLSHQTAVVLHGLPDWCLDLSRVHVTKATGRSATTGTVVRHRSLLPPEDTVRIDELQVSAPARAVVETAGSIPFQAAVGLYDACVRQGLAAAEQIAEVADRLCHWVGAPTARAAVACIDGRSESVGESRLRVILANYGFPPPELQVEILDRDGAFVGRVDFLFPDHKLVVEFDGMVKYGMDGGTALMAEKRREDRIRELGYLVVRVTWSELSYPEVLVKRLRTAFAFASRAA